MALAATTVRSQQGDMLDYLVWKHYGRTEGIVEQVLDHPNNYGLAELPSILPLGTPVFMPVIEEPLVIPDFKLWDNV